MNKKSVWTVIGMAVIYGLSYYAGYKLGEVIADHIINKMEPKQVPEEISNEEI